jgi:hypothetical protein
MEKGKLTPRTGSVVASMRFAGGFGQPDGFGSILRADIRTGGDLCLVLNYKLHDHETFWAVELTNEQRKKLAEFILSYDPVLYENIPSNRT